MRPDSLNDIRLYIRPRNLRSVSFRHIVQIIPTITRLQILLHKTLTSCRYSTLFLASDIHIVDILAFTIASITFAALLFVLYKSRFLNCCFVKSFLASKSLKGVLIILNLDVMCSHVSEWWSLEAGRLVLWAGEVLWLDVVELYWLFHHPILIISILRRFSTQLLRSSHRISYLMSCVNLQTHPLTLFAWRQSLRFRWLNLLCFYSLAFEILRIIRICLLLVKAI